MTLKQLEAPAFGVKNREKMTSLAEMFSIELKFTIDTLKQWFDKRKRTEFLERDDEVKHYFKIQNPITDKTLCSICDFPLEPKAKGGWCDHVIWSEYLFLNNIYTEKEMKIMNIDEITKYSDKVYKILDSFDEFCNSIESETVNSLIASKKDAELGEIKEKIRKIEICENNRKNKEVIYKEKVIAFL